jgi:ribosomal protein S18 acetylase RimI-like enzyme
MRPFIAEQAKYCLNVSMRVSECEYEALEPIFGLTKDLEYVRWANRLETLSSSAVSIREATAMPQDGRRMKDLQAACSPISVRSVRENVSTIIERRVLLAEIDGIHVGFCISFPGTQDSDPMFIQVVAVAPNAQRRGVGLTLLTAAAEREPRRDIALATQDDNVAARSLNEKFARSIGASIGKVNLSTYRDCDLGIQRGLGYRAWAIQRLPIQP